MHHLVDFPIFCEPVVSFSPCGVVRCTLDEVMPSETPRLDKAGKQPITQDIKRTLINNLCIILMPPENIDSYISTIFLQPLS